MSKQANEVIIETALHAARQIPKVALEKIAGQVPVFAQNKADRQNQLDTVLPQLEQADPGVAQHIADAKAYISGIQDYINYINASKTVIEGKQNAIKEVPKNYRKDKSTSNGINAGNQLAAEVTAEMKKVDENIRLAGTMNTSADTSIKAASTATAALRQQRELAAAAAREAQLEATRRQAADAAEQAGAAQQQVAQVQQQVDAVQQQVAQQGPAQPDLRVTALIEENSELKSQMEALRLQMAELMGQRQGAGPQNVRGAGAAALVYGGPRPGSSSASAIGGPDPRAANADGGAGVSAHDDDVDGLSIESASSASRSSSKQPGKAKH